MCGIALILGPGADARAFRRMFGSLAPPGEMPDVLRADDLIAGTQPLRIVDRRRAVQPWVSPDGRWVLCFNGEIFNHRELRAELAVLGRGFGTASDTEVLLTAFMQWGENAVTRLRGEFAFAIADRASGSVYLARDPLGVKPLYWSRSDGCLLVASEVKALVPSGGPVTEIPPGHHGWAEPAAGPDLVPYASLLRPGQGQPPVEDPDEAAKLVRAAFEDSIRVRVDTDLTVGVVLSGGLDSSLVLLQAQDMHPDCVALTIGAPGSEDLAYARRLTAECGI